MGFSSNKEKGKSFYRAMEKEMARDRRLRNKRVGRSEEACGL